MDLYASIVFEKYEEITVNDLDLNSFIIQFNKDEDRIIKQEDDEIILETENKTLYISQKTGLPTKMEVKDANKNTRVYILYNETNYQLSIVFQKKFKIFLLDKKLHDK